MKPRLLTIKNDFYKNVIPSTLKRRDQVVISRIIIGHTKITHEYIPHQRRPTTLRTVQDDPNNGPHTTMRSIPTAKKTTQNQAYSKRQPNGQWNIIKPATISETHQDLQQNIKSPSS